MGKSIENRTTRKLLLGSASALAIGIAFTHGATAAPCGSGSDTTITVACTAPFDWTGGGLSITSLGTISGPGYGVGVASGSVGEFSNSGVVSAASMSYGLSLSAGTSIGKLTNHGTIAGFSTAVDAAGSIGTIANSGLLDTPNYGIRTAAVTGVIDTIVNQAGATINAQWAFYNNGRIGTLTNAGRIKASAIGVNNRFGGTIDVIENTGFINSKDRGIQNLTSIGSIFNSGTIIGGTGVVGTGAGINSPSGTIGTITNQGFISGIAPGLVGGQGSGILVGGTVTEISNSGTIEGNRSGIAVANFSTSTITRLINTGTIRSTGSQGGVLNQGTIDLLLNNGLITGPTYALFNTGSMLLVNAGTIAGNIDNTGTLTISGGSGGTIGTLTGLNGSIGTFTGSGLIFDTGDLLINDTISNGVTVVGTGGNLSNTGMIDTIGTIFGLFVQAPASLASFNNSGEITASTATAVKNAGSIGTLTNSGLVSAGGAGIANSGTITVLTNTIGGLIEGTSSTSGAGIGNSGSIGALTNYGTIQGFDGVLNSGTIDALDNRGAIHGLGGATNSAGIYNYGWISTLTNSGTINAPSAPLIQARTGIYNARSITELTNTGLVSGANFAIYNSDHIDTITNRGRIIGGVTTAAAIYNSGTIGTLTNEGVVGNINNFGSWTLISNAAAGTIHYIYNDGSGVLTELANRGVIEAGISNAGEITTLTNDGTISGASVAIDNQGVIGVLTNNGTIMGPVALSNAAGKTIAVVNAGTIEGNISNYGSLTISGGSNGTVGMLTGLNGSIGSVTGALYFNTGALKLNDVIADGVTVVGQGGSLTNTGTFEGSLSIASGGTLAQFTNTATVSVTGSYGIIASGRVDSINNSGTITGRTAIRPATGSSIGTITNTGTLSGSSYAFMQYTGIDRIENDGEISGGIYAMYGRATSTITTFVNNASGTVNGTTIGIYSLGTIGTLENHGLISSNRAIVSSGSIGSISNSGTIRGSGSIGNGITLTTIDSLTNLAGGLIEGLTSDTSVSGHGDGIVLLGTINTLTNAGTIHGNMVGITTDLWSWFGTLNNSGTISGDNTGFVSNDMGALTNTGVISGNVGLHAYMAIDTLTNAGTISGATAILNDSAIATLINSGLIEGTTYALNNSLNGSIDLINSGTIAGNIRNANGLTISGGSNGTVGTLTGYNGSLGTFTGSALVFDTGALVLNDVISEGVTVVGTGGLLTNTGSIGSISGVNLGSLTSLETLTNSGTIAGGMAAVLNYGSIGTLANSGSVIAVDAGIANADTITKIINTETGTIESTGSGYFAAGILSYRGSIGSIENRGLISAVAGGVAVFNAATISALTNWGTIESQGGSAAIINGAGGIGTLDNRGRIAGGGTITGGTSSYAAIANSDTIAALTNSGKIEGLGVGAAIGNTGSIIALTNTGAITGHNAIENEAQIGSISNSGTIKATGPFGLSNTGTIQELTNSGLLVGGNGLWNWGQIDSIVNSGIINGTTSAGLGNTTGTIGTLSNSGLITGKYSAIGNTGAMSIVNSGTIAGDIVNNGSLTISGDADGAFGTVTGLNGALATVTGNSINFDAGALEVHAVFTKTLNVTGTGGALSNTGTINTLAVASNASLATLVNSGTIQAGTGAAIHNLGNIGVISNSGVIDGAITSTSALTFAGGTATGTLTGGVITAPSVEFASGTLVLKDNIHGDASLTGSTLIVAAGEQIDGQLRQSAGTLDLTNTGIWTVTGTAHITGGTVLARNLLPTENYLAGDAAGTLIDAASGSSYSGLAVRFGGISELVAGPDTSSTDDLRIVYLNDYIGGNLPTLGNTGSIGGADYGVFVAAGGSIGTFSNSGTLGGSSDAFFNGGTINLFNNDGIIADGSGVDNTCVILVLTNNGLIEGDAGIHNTGTIGALVNTGTITGPNFAIDNTGSLGPISGSGTIHGNIRSTSPLFISGGTGSTFGILTNGTIAADVNFTSGNLRLSDAIVGQASNSGAVLQLASAVTITGAYSQTAGTLDLGSSTLTVSGTANVTGGTITASLSPTANYLAGQSVILIDGGSGSSYAGATLDLSTLPSLSAAASTGGEDLAVSIRNNYIGGSLASLNNTGTLSGSSYGVYVASTGTLGALANTDTLRGTQYAIYSAGSLGTVTNSGLISGNIYSAGVLVLAGSGGTLSGGTITAAGVSIAGSLRLADNINVGSGTVSAGTASVELSSKISITGNYLQTGGVLISDVTDTTAYGALAVSGSASITNTTITVNGTSVRSGQTYTIVDAGAASSYTGDTINLVGAHYRAELSTVGDDLVASIKAMFGEIGVAKGGGAAAMGGVLDRLSSNAGLQTVIDRLSLLSDADLGRALEQAAPAEVGGGVASLQRMSLIEDLIGGAVSRRRSAATGWSVWQEVLGGAAQRSAVSGASGYNTTAAGLVLGVDNRMRENLLVGAALSWSAGWNAGRGDVSGNANGMNGFALTGYGSWTDGALTVNGRMAIGLDHYNQHRAMTYLDDKAEADYSGRHYVIAADGSYDFDLAPSMTLSPQASLRWLRMTAEGYSESGIGGLTVGSAIADQVQSSLGAKLAMALDTRFGLEFRAAWLHDFINGPGETNAVLGGISFTTTSARISANGIRLGTGLTFYQSDATSLRLEYDGEFRDDYTAHGGMLQLSLGL